MKTFQIFQGYLHRATFLKNFKNAIMSPEARTAPAQGLLLLLGTLRLPSPGKKDCDVSIHTVSDL